MRFLMLAVLCVPCLWSAAEEAGKPDAAKPEKEGRKTWPRQWRVISRGQVDKVERMIDKDPNLLTNPRWLEIMATHGNAEIAELFIEKGAEANAKGRGGHSLLHRAAASGNCEALGVLLKHKANMEEKAPRGQTALHLAALSGQQGTVEALLDNGASVDAKSTGGTTPLHLAAQNGHTEVVVLLIRYKAEADTRSRGGMTPLHLACRAGSVDTVKALLAFGADPKGKSGRNSKSKTPAEMTESSAIKRLLASHRRGMKYGYETHRRPDSEKAASMLSVAKSYANNSIYVSARRHAKTIIAQYPDTEAAKEAAKLLKQIEGKEGED